jgi:hypothetical protein
MVGAVVGFLITTPGVIFNFTRFWEDFSFERGHMMNSNFDLTFQQTPPGWIYHIVPNLSTGFGGLLLIFCVAGLIWGLTRRDKSIWIILSFGALYFLMIGSFQVKFLRYTFPLYPVLAVGGGYWLGRVWESSKWRWLGLGAFIVVLTYTLVPMMKMTGYMISLDPRDEAAKYIRAQVPTGSKIGFAKVPWFYSPPLFPETNAPGPPQARLDLMSKQPNLVMAQGSDWNLDLIWQIRPNCIILTQFETMEEARLKLPEYEAFMDALRGQYRLVNRWGEGFMAPHDLLYIHPEVQLWQRQ